MYFVVSGSLVNTNAVTIFTAVNLIQYSSEFQSIFSYELHVRILTGKLDRCHLLALLGNKKSLYKIIKLVFTNCMKLY